MNRSIDKAFKLWLSEGLLDETQVDALRASLNHAQESRSSPSITIIATFGAVLVGLGILLFVAGIGVSPFTRVECRIEAVRKAHRPVVWQPGLVKVGVLAATRDDVIDSCSHFLSRHVFCATPGRHSAERDGFIIPGYMAWTVERIANERVPSFGN